MNYQSYFFKKVNNSEVFQPNSSNEEVEELSPTSECFDTSVLNTIAAIVTCIFIIGLINNVLACIVIVSSKSMHTATNCYLFSLSMSDILMLVTGTTQEMYNIYNPSQISFGLVGCSVKNWAAEMSVNVSVLTIAAFTIERYLAICHPFYTKMTPQFSRTVKILVAVWVLAALTALAPALKTEIVWELNDCYVDRYFIPYYLEVSSIIFFIMPMILMTIMYIRIWLCLQESRDWKSKNNPKNCRESHSPNSRNTLKMFVMIVVTFFVCWIPFHVQRLMTSHILLYIEDPGTSFDLIMCILKHGSIISYLLTAVLDPIIYSIMSVKFRQALKDLLSKSSNIASNIHSTKTNTTRFSQYSNRK